MELSIVIPAYNEERRLPRTLDKLIIYLNEFFRKPYEIIIVDDGSTDATSRIISDYSKKYPFVSTLRQKQNKGRGAAVRSGVLGAHGSIILETDADGSIDEEAVVRFCTFMRDHNEVDVLIGSRNMAGAEILTPQPLLRVVLGEFFLYTARILFDWSITDFTLGFKMFRKRAVEDIFLHQYDNQYVAEAEIVVVANQRGWKVQELPVLWTDYRDSRVYPFYDSIRSFSALLKLFWRIKLGGAANEAGNNISYSLQYAYATKQIKKLYGGLGWPSIFARIRFFTAPYKHLAKLVPQDGLVVDLGCGYGTFSNLLALMSSGRHVLGLELDNDKIKYADRGITNAEFKLADINSADIPVADCILLIHVLHHLGSYVEQEILLKKCYQKLKKGGMLIICEVDHVPYYKFLLARRADYLLYPGQEIFYRFPESLSALIKKEQFEVQSMPSHFGTPFSHVTYVCKKI